MKKQLVGTLFVMVGLFSETTMHGQGTYVSNLGSPTTGSLSVASNAWLATWFRTGSATEGYSLDSIQISMATPSGTPDGFTVMLWDFNLDRSIATLAGPNPSTSGVFTYTATALTLAPSTVYWFAVKAATPLSVGAFRWDHAAARNDTPGIDGWLQGAAYQTSLDGIDWDRSTQVGNLKFAVTATAIPEPSAMSLILLGGGALIYARRRKKRLRS